ncbi:MAG: alcohol dehydrogenase catalytic domain-containing protein [Caldilineaceae bacterium]|nr:alcohol dehydrogenase catalytic domain-containing protein [Caldilineaceae bacterium]
MKAALLRQLGQPLVIEEVPTPLPGPGEVLVKTQACGICATDLHILAGWGYEPTLPFIMGHEPAGIVHALGPGVTGFAPGDRVVPNIFYTCGNCRYCRTNRETLCTNLGGILGVLNHHGAYAEYFTVPARQLFHLPEVIAFADGAVIADAVVCAMHALKQRAQVYPGDQVLVIGIGGVGLSVIQAARTAGAQVIATDIRQEKVDQARQLGALGLLFTDQPSWVAAIKALTQGEGVDVVFDCHGSEQTLGQGVNALRKNGRLVIIGYTQERWPLAPQWMSRFELEIVGSRSGGRQDTADAIALVATPHWQSIVSDHFPLAQINEALALLKSGKARGRIVMTMDG